MLSKLLARRCAGALIIKRIKEPLINSKITQRDLKRAIARRRLQLMALSITDSGALIKTATL